MTSGAGDRPDWWINPKPNRNRSTCSNERKARLKATEKGADQFVFIMEKLEMVGLAGDEDKFPSEISGGLRKRAGLAMRFGAGATDHSLRRRARLGSGPGADGI